MVSPLSFCRVCVTVVGVAVLIPPLGKADEYEGRRYDGHQVLRSYPRSTRDLQVLQRLKIHPSIKVEFWHPPTSDTGEVEILVPPAEKASVHTYLQSHSIKYEVSEPDLQQAIEHQQAEAEADDGDSSGLKFTKYNTLDTIVSWLLNMEKENPEMLSVIKIGNSVEGRPIYTVKLSVQPQKKKKSSIWLDAGIHANEWVGPATMTYFIQQILDEYRKGLDFKDLLQKFDWFITPVINVDGYHYSWTKDRMWRKNRNKHLGSECVGVDLNRNWGVHWSEGTTAARDPCDRMYIGSSPMSEPEVVAVADFLRLQNGSTVAYLAFHNFGQLWMTPYSYSKQAVLPGEEELLNISRAAADSIEKVHGSKYRVGRIAQIVGEASGASVDYTHDALGIDYSFGVELRDRGRFGTLLPADQIISTAQEALEGLKTLGILLAEKF